MPNKNLYWIKNWFMNVARFVGSLSLIVLGTTALPVRAQVSIPCEPGCLPLRWQRLRPGPQAPQVPEVPQPPVEVVQNPPPTTTSPSSLFAYAVPTAPANWSGYNPTLLGGKPVGQTFAQESGVLRLEVRKEYGGSIQIYDKITKQNLINFLDKGRETGMSSYGGPTSFSDDAPVWKGVGYNPLQAGDSGGNPAKLLAQGVVDGYIYTKYQCNSWAHTDNRMLAFFYEQWVRLDDNKVHVYVRLTHARLDKTFYGPFQQEWPMMMINGTRRVRFYAGAAPFTKAPTSSSNGIERQTGTTYVTHQLTPFQIPEPRMATEIGQNAGGGTRLIGLTGPEFLRVSYNMHAIQSGDNDEGGNTITYWAHHPMVHLDSDGIWLKEYTYVVGSEEQIREYAYAQPRMARPDFVFTKDRGRNGWYLFDGGYDQKEPFRRDNWTVNFEGKGDPGKPANARITKIVSPVGSWRAADAGTIFVKMRYKGDQDHLNLVWLLNGQAPDGLDSNYPNQNATRAPRGVRNRLAQSVPIKLINDGKMHTYKINVATNSLWKDVVQQFEIAHDPEGPVVPPGEEIELVYFGVNDPG